MGLDVDGPQGFPATVWLSNGSGRSWTLQALTEPCAWSLRRLHLLKDLGLLVDAHALIWPSSRLGADFFQTVKIQR